MPTDAGGSYQAYLLRLWQVETADRPVWRASLKEIHSGEQRQFADLEALVTFLREEGRWGSSDEDTPED